MRLTWIAVAATVCVTAAVAVTSTAVAAPADLAGSTPAGVVAPARIGAGPAFGLVPVRGAGASHAKTQTTARIFQLSWHGGPVRHSSTVVPVFWGSRWTSSTFASDKISGLDYLYSHFGGSSYLHTNSEYTDSSGHVNTTNVSKSADLADSSATPSGAPSTLQVLQEVAKVTGNHPVANAYYPVYSDQPRGNAGYCAWHSSGTINGTRVQFGFFFSLDGDPGCSANAPSNIGYSQGLASLANVSGHEFSEMLTDPQLNAWYDQKGAENADKCAWTFSGLVNIGGVNWKIQGNWSNAAANAGTGYYNRGCIETS
jgi:hypothetical protein